MDKKFFKSKKDKDALQVLKERAKEFFNDEEMSVYDQLTYYKDLQKFWTIGRNYILFGETKDLYEKTEEELLRRGDDIAIIRGLYSYYDNRGEETLTIDLEEFDKNIDIFMKYYEAGRKRNRRMGFYL